MPAVTQRIENYLGGVSRQSDDKKLPGQVKECLNGYPDPTFGLTKRPGFKWIKNLGTGTTYDNSKWFYIARSKDEKYIGCITPKPESGYGDIDIWNVDGTVCSVTMDTSTSTNAVNYLTGSRLDYKIITVQNKSIVINSLHTAQKLADPTFNANRQATIVLSGSPVSNLYTVVINGTTFTHTSNASGTYSSILGALKTSIDSQGISGLTTVKYRESLQLTDSNSAITITGEGGQDGSALYVFQDEVDNRTQLPEQTFDGHLVKVNNTESVDDTYFAKFSATDGTSGPGSWDEGLDPSKSTGLDGATMPHELVYNSANTFTFRQISWTARTVGDDDTNSHPSFEGKKINGGFFYSNRLGFLSEDSISMGQVQKDDNFYNFYFTSAQTVTDSDPIDLKASTIRPTTLYSVLPTTQGLMLFSKDQQFLMTASGGVITPTATSIRVISSYDMDTDINPVDSGGIINFISKTPSYTRTFGMQTFGQDDNPKVLDIGRVVNEWVPATVDTMISSPQNRFLAFSDQSSRYVYFFRTYSDGKENLVEAWFNWQLPGNVQTIATDSDDFYAITKQGNQFTLSKASLSQSPTDAIIVNNDGQRINPCMDLYTAASNAAGNNKVDYDSTNDFSKVYIPWANVTGLTPVIIIKGTTATGQFIESGFTTTPEVITNDGSDPYFKVLRKDLTSIEDDVVVGWKYTLDVQLPKTYYRLDDAGKMSDFTSNLTVNRMKFALGLSGVVGFKLKSKGVRQGKKEYIGDGSTTIFNWVAEDFTYIDDDQIKVTLDGVVTTAFTVSADKQITFNSAPANNVKIVIYLDEWYKLNPAITADTYLANDIAITDQSVVALPIHQRSDNFRLRVFNDTPFPVSINSMMWEGHYSPRNYRRT